MLQEGLTQLTIKNLVSGMRSVDLVGKVVRIFEPRDWEKGEKKGSVCNLFLADETGVVRLSLWNEDVDMIRNNEIKEDDVVKIRGGYVKTGYKGDPELSVGKGRIEVVKEEIKLPEKIEIDSQQIQQAKRIPINEFKEGISAETRSSIVQVYRRNPFYEVCPECGSRVSQENDKFVCKEHGIVQPKYNVVLSCVIDDGFGNIRAVFFREMAEKISGMKTEELRKLAGEDSLSLYDSLDFKGKDFILRGRIRRNSFTEEMELIVSDAEEVKAEDECENIIKGLEGKI